MRITLDVPDHLANQLSREAARVGLPLDQHVIRLLADRTSVITQMPALTGAELVEYWNREGAIGSRPDIDDPVKFSRELRTRSESRGHPPTEP